MRCYFVLRVFLSKYNFHFINQSIRRLGVGLPRLINWLNGKSPRAMFLKDDCFSINNGTFTREVISSMDCLQSLPRPRYFLISTTPIAQRGFRTMYGETLPRADISVFGDWPATESELRRVLRRIGICEIEFHINYSKSQLILFFFFFDFQCVLSCRNHREYFSWKMSPRMSKYFKHVK